MLRTPKLDEALFSKKTVDRMEQRENMDLVFGIGCRLCKPTKTGRIKNDKVS